MALVLDEAAPLTVVGLGALPEPLGALEGLEAILDVGLMASGAFASSNNRLAPSQTLTLSSHNLTQCPLHPALSSLAIHFIFLLTNRTSTNMGTSKKERME